MIPPKWLQIIEEAKTRTLAIDEIVNLTLALANSGRVEKFNGIETYDIASTGGPSSLSTLICPLFLSAQNASVPKLGVPGRPAGGIDVLSQIPNYKVNIEPKLLPKILANAQYAHFLSNGIYAPLDAETFEYRKTVGAQAVPELAIASLLAKKLAVDVKNIGLDVRVSKHGNVGSTIEEAVLFARKFNSVARHFGKRAICFLTDASIPFQPYIGRGEALLALHQIFEQRTCNWLKEHMLACEKMANSLLNSVSSVTHINLRDAFEKNISAQGSSYKNFETAVNNVKNQFKIEILSKSDGYLFYNLEHIRNLITSLQLSNSDREVFPDTIGMRLLVEPNGQVVKGQPIISIRCANREHVSESVINSCELFSIISKPKLQNEMVVIDE